MFFNSRGTIFELNPNSRASNCDHGQSWPPVIRASLKRLPLGGELAKHAAGMPTQSMPKARADQQSC